MATINDILTEVSELKPHQYEDPILIKSISNLEGKIIDSVFNTHEWDKDPIEFNGYDEYDVGAELLVPDPYSEVYKWYCFAMIDLYNGETDRYQTSMQMFNNSFTEFSNYWNNTHLPIGRHLKL